MPRKARITVVGAVHHIMCRGIEGNPIFRSDDDKRYLLALIERNILRSGYLLYAWCFMENHYHLVIRINEYPLHRFMRMINGPYAQYFRRHQALRGYLFQDRYKSIATQDQLYIEELVRYVHLNPVRAGMCRTVKDLKHYYWSGHGVLVGVRNWAAQNTHDVLQRFGVDTKGARKGYERFLQEGCGTDSDVLSTIRAVNNEAENMHSSACWVIGNREFVARALSQAEERRVKVSHHAKAGVGLEEIACRICSQYNLHPEEIMRRGRNGPVSEARRRLAYEAVDLNGFSVGSVAQFLGITSPSVSNMLACWKANEGR